MDFSSLELEINRGCIYSNIFVLFCFPGLPSIFFPFTYSLSSCLCHSGRDFWPHGRPESSRRKSGRIDPSIRKIVTERSRKQKFLFSFHVFLPFCHFLLSINVIRRQIITHVKQQLVQDVFAFLALEPSRTSNRTLEKAVGLSRF